MITLTFECDRCGDVFDTYPFAATERVVHLARTLEDATGGGWRVDDDEDEVLCLECAAKLDAQRAAEPDDEDEDEDGTMSEHTSAAAVTP